MGVDAIKKENRGFVQDIEPSANELPLVCRGFAIYGNPIRLKGLSVEIGRSTFARGELK